MDVAWWHRIEELGPKPIHKRLGGLLFLPGKLADQLLGHGHGDAGRRARKLQYHSGGKVELEQDWRQEGQL
jgi:hypothetical protein